MHKTTTDLAVTYVASIIITQIQIIIIGLFINDPERDPLSVEHLPHIHVAGYMAIFGDASREAPSRAQDPV